VRRRRRRRGMSRSEEIATTHLFGLRVLGLGCQIDDKVPLAKVFFEDSVNVSCERRWWRW